MTTSILIVGGGGHAKVLLDALLKRTDIIIKGILDKNPDLHGQTVLGVPILGSEEDILNDYHPSHIQLVNGLGSAGLPETRKAVFEKCKEAGFQFLSVVHPAAYLAYDVTMGEGSQCMAGSVIQTSARIGSNAIVNTNVSIDHDCVIGDHVHLAPGVVCCGNVTIGKGTHVGCGAVIKQGVTIAENCLIAAGALVVKDIPAGSKVAGLPAREFA